jgi:hypothetical protein
MADFNEYVRSLKLGLTRLRQPGFVEDFAVARGLRRDKLGLFFGGPEAFSFSYPFVE